MSKRLAWIKWKTVIVTGGASGIGKSSITGVFK